VEKIGEEPRRWLGGLPRESSRKKNRELLVSGSGESFEVINDDIRRKRGGHKGGDRPQ